MRFSKEERIFKITVLDSAKYRKIPVSINLPQFLDVARRECHYCGRKPSERNYARGKTVWVQHDSLMLNGIDRKDSSLGYTPENCLPCCPICNFAKRDTPYDDFMNMVKSIYDRHLK